MCAIQFRLTGTPEIVLMLYFEHPTGEWLRFSISPMPLSFVARLRKNLARINALYCIATVARLVTLH